MSEEMTDKSDNLSGLNCKAPGSPYARTCKNFHVFRMNGLWWCRAPYDPTKLEAAVSATGSTPAEAHRKLMDILVSPDFVPPPSTPRSQELHRRWQDAELRQKMGLHRPWSSLDCAVRNGFTGEHR